MCKFGDYLKEPAYLLELNLQAVRRELIHMLDESEATECFACNRLKCSCRQPKGSSSLKSSTMSVLTSEASTNPPSCSSSNTAGSFSGSSSGSISGNISGSISGNSSGSISGNSSGSISGNTSDNSPSNTPSNSSSEASTESAEEVPVAPPAQALPKPSWTPVSVANWIRASTSTPNPSSSQDNSRNIFEMSQDEDTIEVKSPKVKVDKDTKNLSLQPASTEVIKVLSRSAPVVNEPSTSTPAPNIQEPTLLTPSTILQKTYKAISNLSNLTTVTPNISMNLTLNQPQASTYASHFTAPISTFARINATLTTYACLTPNSTYVGVNSSTPSYMSLFANNTPRVPTPMPTPVLPSSANVSAASSVSNVGQDVKEIGQDSKAWPKPVWGNVDGAKRSANEQTKDTVEAFFKSFSEVAGSSSSVGYSYF